MLREAEMRDRMTNIGLWDRISVVPIKVVNRVGRQGSQPPYSRERTCSHTGSIVRYLTTIPYAQHPRQVGKTIVMGKKRKSEFQISLLSGRGFLQRAKNGPEGLPRPLIHAVITTPEASGQTTAAAVVVTE